MDDSFTRVKGEIDRMIEPYLGKQNYGDLRMVVKDYAESGGEIMLTLLSDDPLGSSKCQSLFYVNGKFGLGISFDEKSALPPDKALEHIRSYLQSIKSWRFKNLEILAKRGKEDGATLENIIEIVKKPMRDKQPYAATQEELQQFERKCGELYSK